MYEDCHVWLGAVDNGGYGFVQVKDVHGRWWRQGAHRVAWECERGPIPTGMFVCHRCDNPPCCNVDHLFLGTPADNTRDAKSKGRPLGEPRALPADVEAELVRERRSGVKPRHLAVRYGVTPKQVWRIVARHRNDCIAPTLDVIGELT